MKAITMGTTGLSLLVAAVLLAVAVAIPRGSTLSFAKPRSVPQERVVEREVPVARTQPRSSRRIVIVDDDPDYAKSMIMLIALDFRKPDYYPTCEMLLSAMATGLRWQVYIVDNQLDKAGQVLWGPACTVKIIALDKAAIVIGLSADDSANIFRSKGATEFVSKRTGPRVLLDVLSKLFP